MKMIVAIVQPHMDPEVGAEVDDEVVLGVAVERRWHTRQQQQAKRDEKEP